MKAAMLDIVTTCDHSIHNAIKIQSNAAVELARSTSQLTLAGSAAVPAASSSNHAPPPTRICSLSSQRENASATNLQPSADETSPGKECTLPATDPAGHP
eukprot:INCI17655.2.p2 GENE.INCI17655.2~~INCI17655.2.p2  ORF type:complete len:100 (+),score=9.25 INCI17655.2:157-456(+)